MKILMADDDLLVLNALKLYWKKIILRLWVIIQIRMTFLKCTV